VVADERATTDLGPDFLTAFESRLIVGTRFGGNLRSRLEGGRRIAFTSLPLRADSLRTALFELRRDPRKKADEPPRLRNREYSAARVGMVGSRPLVSSPPTPANRILLSNFADFIEKAIASGTLSTVEQAAKDAQRELADAGEAVGARLAFSALLQERKGDAEGLNATVIRLRAIIDRIAAAGEEGKA